MQEGKSIYKRDGTTLNLHEVFNSLKGLNIHEQPRLEEIHDLRNVIQHKGLTPDQGTTQFSVEIAYYFVKRFLAEELKIQIESFLPRETRALMERQPLLFEQTEEVAAAFKQAQTASSPSDKIVLGYIALNRAVDVLVKKEGMSGNFRKTFRTAAKVLGKSDGDAKILLDTVMRLRNQVVHSGFQPTEEDAEIFLDSAKQLLELVGCILEDVE